MPAQRLSPSVRILLFTLCLGATLLPPVWDSGSQFYRQPDRPDEKRAALTQTSLVPPSHLSSGSSSAVKTERWTERRRAPASKPDLAGKRLPGKSAAQANKRAGEHEKLVGKWSSSLAALNDDAMAAGKFLVARLEKASGHRLSEVKRWLTRLTRQLTSPAVDAPAGAPYIVDRYMHAPIYLTAEGRLKTVVSR